MELGGTLAMLAIAAAGVLVQWGMLRQGFRETERRLEKNDAEHAQLAARNDEEHGKIWRVVSQHGEAIAVLNDRSMGG